MNEIIKTGVTGLDTILNGGIVFEKEVVIVLRGARGIFKTLLGMQIMRGIQHYFVKKNGQTEREFPIHFYSLNKSEETLNTMFGGIMVSSEVERIKKDSTYNTDKLRSYLNGIRSGYVSLEEEIRRQILTFDSNLGRFFQGGKETPITIKNDIRKDYYLSLISSENTNPQTNYLSSGLKDFSEMMKDIERVSSDKGKKEACIVVDGLSRMTEEELKRLPLVSSEKELRNRSKVSILILNDKETLRNLDADIIIDMQRRIDPVHNYTYHELSVVKNVKGQFAFGWHKYKPMNGLIYVYPSIHKLLSQQYSVDNTFIQAINTDARYPQSFAEKNDVEPSFPKTNPNKSISDNDEKNDIPTTKNEIISKLITPHKDEVEKGHVTSVIGNHNTFKRFIVSVSILNSVLSEHEVFVLLLNEKRKGMLELIDKIRNDAGINVEVAKEAYQHLFFWEVRMGCISPEELISFVLEYIELQRKKQKKHIDIFIIDLGTIEQCFPMINNESLFVPTLSTLCRESKVNLNLICNKHFSQRSVVCTVADNLICTRRNPGNNNNQLTMLLEKNDFGPNYNCKVYELRANVYKGNCFNVSNENGMVVFAANTTEISTTKDYWRKTVNVVSLKE